MHLKKEHFWSTHLSDFLNGSRKDVDDDYPLLKSRPLRHFHQHHICVQHQVAQVEELNMGDK